MRDLEVKKQAGKPSGSGLDETGTRFSFLDLWIAISKRSQIATLGRTKLDVTSVLARFGSLELFVIFNL